MRKMRRIFVRSVWAVATLLVVVTALVLFLLTTQPGAALIVGYFESRLPIDLAVADVEGRLLGPLELGNVRLTVSGVTFEVDHLGVDWRPYELLNGRRVHLEAVRIDGLRVTVRGKRREDGRADSTPPTQTEIGADSISLPVELEFEDLRISNGSLSVPEVLELRDVRLHARGTPESYTAGFSALAELLNLPAAQVSASGTGGLNSFAFDSLRSGLLRGELRAEGSVSWKPQVAWRLAVEADTLAPADLAPNPTDWPGRLSLAAAARGGLEDGLPSLQIDVDTLYGSLRGQPVAGTLSGSIEGPEYEISRADLDWGQIRIDAAGGISRQRLDLAFELEAPDLNTALPRASGSVSATGKLAGSPSSPRIAGSLQAQTVTLGQIKLDSARAVVDLDWASRSRNEAVVKLSGLEIANQAVDSAEIELRGLRENHTLTARIGGHQARVALQASGGLRDSRWEGFVNDFSIGTDKLGDWRIEDDVRLALSGRSVEIDEMCVVAEEGSVCVGGSWASEVGWRASSSLERLPLTLLDPFLPAGWSATGQLSGELSGSGAGARVEKADVDVHTESGVLEYPTAGRADAFEFDAVSLSIHADADSLSGEFALEFTDASQARAGSVSGHALLPPIDALSREARLEGALKALRDDWQISLTIDALSLSLFDRFLPQGMRLYGSLNGSLAALAATDGELTAQLDLTPESAVLVRELSDEVRTLQFIEPSLRMHVNADGLSAETRLAAAQPDSAPHLTLSGIARLPEYTNVAQSIESQIMEAELAGAVNLSLIDAVVEEFSGTQGRFAVDFAGRGTLAEPEITGRYSISGQTDIPALGIELREIELSAIAGPEGALDITGGLTSGDGRLEIAGEAPLIPSRENPGRLAIRGAHFLAMQGDQTTLVVSPDLEVLWTGTTIRVTGDVTIPRATIEIIEIPETAVPVSEDVVVVGAESVPRRPMDVTADVRLVLGSEILFKGFGFTTNVEGTLQLVEQPGLPTQGRGELVLREGVFRGYGQNLTIDPGRLIFAGPIDDPGLSVRAYRRATDGTRAGFLIGGTLKSPDLQVWSDPAMSESSVLSYVLFGRSAEQGSSAEQAQAGSAAAILGGNILAMSMASRVGLDDARIEAGARQQDAAFYAGKYLSPKLYVAYGTGLFEPTNVIRVRYLISRKLTLQTETGSRDSGDVLYRIEY